MVGTMRRLLLPLCAALLLAPASGASASGGTGRLLVTVTPGAQRAPAARAAAAQAVAASADARPSGFSVPQIGLVTVRPRPGESMRALARRLRADPRVASVQAENRGRVRFQPNDPALVAPEPSPASVPGTTVEWWAARSNFLAAWDLSDGSGARVAVIDTGAEIAHPEFIGRVAGLTSFDATRSPAGLDTIGHGTHVASLACAAGNNGVGLVGAGLGCRLLVVKSDFSDSSVAASIVWAVDHGADAITMSFGTAAGAQPSLPVVNAIDYAVKRGVVLVSAAADDPIADQGYPSSVLQPTNTGPDLSKGRGLSVTAADFYDRRASFAGYGTQISLAAYGSYTGGTGSGPPGIFGAFTSAQNALDTGALGNMRPCGCRTTFGADARYAYLQGTSMAAPMVAAASALVRRPEPGPHGAPDRAPHEGERPPPGGHGLESRPRLGDPRRRRRGDRGAQPRRPPAGLQGPPPRGADGLEAHRALARARRPAPQRGPVGHRPLRAVALDRRPPRAATADHDAHLAARHGAPRRPLRLLHRRHRQGRQPRAEAQATGRAPHRSLTTPASAASSSSAASSASPIPSRSGSASRSPSRPNVMSPW